MDESPIVKYGVLGLCALLVFAIERISKARSDDAKENANAMLEVAKAFHVLKTFIEVKMESFLSEIKMVRRK